jgi:Flp pilus assembly protein TadD
MLAPVTRSLDVMCRNWALAATAVALCLAPGVMQAKDKDKAMAKPVEAAAPAAPAPRAKASPAERQMIERGPPLARAAFWAREADLDPKDEQAAVGLTQALRAMGNYDDAIAAIGKLLMVEPNSFEALVEFARVHIAAGRGFYAIEPAKRAQSLAPRDWRPATLIAVAYEQAQRDDEARAAHETALAMAPQNPTVLSNYGMFLAAHGETARAETLLRTAAARPDATIQVRQNLALVLGLEGRLTEAEKLARQDLPPELVANNMAYLRAAAGQDSQAPSTGRTWEALRATP